ncbi:MAG: DUF2188 domain-containing protein [Pseudomonadota bacterium]
MSKRRIYDVKTSGDEWVVKERGADRAVGVFENKTDAVERARQIANNQDLAQVVIRKMDGTIQTEHTYGSDPFPPKG